VQGGGDGAGPLPFAMGAAPAGCDIGQGEWVYDEAARPVYQEWECPYIHPELTCQAHGRPDKSYQHWRWQPRGCSLPRYGHGTKHSSPPSPAPAVCLGSCIPSVILAAVWRASVAEESYAPFFSRDSPWAVALLCAAIDCSWSTPT
jgi:hypothetical protein